MQKHSTSQPCIAVTFELGNAKLRIEVRATSILTLASLALRVIGILIAMGG